jgi:transcription initiation factor IIE alpha subunit
MVPIEESPNMILVVRAMRDERKKLDADACAALLRIDRRNARRYLQRLHAKGKAHIKEWKRTTRATPGPWSPVYLYGPGQDAPKPELETEADRRRRQRATKRASRRLAPAGFQGDPLITAIFGRPRRKRR